MPITVFPTGTVRYQPDKCWNGYNLFSIGSAGTFMVDMNGRIVKKWQQMNCHPAKMLPGGILMGSTGMRDNRYGFMDWLNLVQVDWNEEITWKFDKYELISDPGESPAWMARQHHDFQREGNPVGYYVPGMEPRISDGNTLVLAHKEILDKSISDKKLLDDTFIEVDEDGHINWEWVCSQHFSELGFSEEAKTAIYRNPNMVGSYGVGDWMHINSMSRIGPNKWFDEGDVRFHPDNIIWDAREANIIAITDRKTGKIVWRLGPDYTGKPLDKLAQIIGQHHAHIIPRGLPGEGDILLFDNGGWAGYGKPNVNSPGGLKTAVRDYSRIIEFNPVTLELVWQYSAGEAGCDMPMYGFRFYSPLVSSAQRLPNGNTLITEGMDGRIFEVTPQYETVWEYVSPFSAVKPLFGSILFYRCYRVPYSWVPQLKKKRERAVTPISNSEFRILKSRGGKSEGGKSQFAVSDEGQQFCVIPEQKIVDQS